ncbi:MAG: tRNA1(Val) (adenine(37)-N6)-methyltransferase [Mangrovicoccus sp.]
MTITSDLTHDRFLGGAVAAWQPAKGYRAGVDAVLLAAALLVQPGDKVLELGCGVGVASLCLAARVPQASITGVELQPDYADLARRNAAEAGADFEIVTADLTNLPPEIRQQSFDHVFANPPYFRRERSIAAQDPGRDTALGGATPLRDWIDTGIRRLGPKGRFTMIQRAERLPEILAALDDRVGAVQVLPLNARETRRAEHVLVSAQKGRKTDFRLHASLILHSGMRHGDAEDGYTPLVSAALNGPNPLPGLEV